MSSSNPRRGPKPATSLKALSYFVDVLAMLAIIFLIQAESASKQREEVHNQQTEQQVARVEELEKRIKEYEEKEQRLKTVNLEDQLSEYEQDVKQTTQKIQGLYAQLDKAIQHKDTSLQRYQNVLADMETKYNDKVHHLEDKNIQQKQNFFSSLN